MQEVPPTLRQLQKDTPNFVNLGTCRRLGRICSSTAARGMAGRWMNVAQRLHARGSLNSARTVRRQGDAEPRGRCPSSAQSSVL